MRGRGGRLVLSVLVVGLVVAGLLSPAQGATSRSMSLSVSPATVDVGGSVTFSGTVSTSPNGTTVAIQRRSGSSWVTVTTARTSSSRGGYSAVVRPSTAGTFTYRTSVAATKTLKAVTSASRTVTVRRKTTVSLTASPTSVQTGGQVRFSGKVAPARSGSTVDLQRQSGSSWVKVVSTTTGAGGAFAAPVTLRTAGSYRFRVVKKVHGTDAASTSAAVTVTVTAPPVDQPFSSAPTPTVAGTPRVGVALTAEEGAWSPAPSFAYQWSVGGQSVVGATARTFTPRPVDVGKQVTVAVTGTRAGSVTTTRTSAATAAVVSGVFATAPVVVNGTAKPGQTLTANLGAWSPAPTTVTYQWRRDGQPITGATSQTYAVVDADLDADLTVVASGAASGYASASVTSDAVTVTPDADVATVGGTLTQDTTWSPSRARVYHVTEDLTVAEGVTLTIRPGTVVKVEDRRRLDVVGTMVATGTEARPVVLTALADDAVGGDSNGDGGESAPAAGDWYGIERGVRTGSITLDRVVVRYPDQAVVSPYRNDSQYSTLSVTNSRFEHTLTDRPVIEGWFLDRPRISGNTFVSTGRPVQVQESLLDLARLSGNTTDGANRELFLSGSLEEDASLPISGNLVPTFSGNPSFVIPEGVTLSVGPGAVAKVDFGHLLVLGELRGVGTESAPAVFTSSRDDSVGGDSNGDGGESAPAAGDWYGIERGVRTGSITLDRVVVRYPDQALLSPYRNDSQYSTLSVTNSRFEHTLTDRPVIEGWFLDRPRISGNTFVSTGRPVQVQESLLDLARLSGNTTDGANRELFLSGSLEEDASLPISGNLVPTIYGNPSFVIPEGVTLTVGPGAVAKFQHGQLLVLGEVLGGGTTSDPAVLTTMYDDSAGGDSSDDGDATDPDTNRWRGIRVAGQGQVDLASTRIGYATTGLEVETDPEGESSDLIDVDIDHGAFGLSVIEGTVTFRGAFSDLDRHVMACRWDAGCSVDAAYSDWDGAAPDFSGLEPKVCGAVSVDHWKGSAAGNPFGLVAHCDGSPTPTQQVATAQDQFAEAISTRQILCGQGFEDACAAIETAQRCLSAAFSLAAGGSTFPMPNVETGSNDAYGQHAVGSFLDYKAAESAPFPSAFGKLGFAYKLFGAINTILAVRNAYDQCLP